jgi:hypothetical protein
MKYQIDYEAIKNDFRPSTLWLRLRSGYGRLDFRPRRIIRFFDTEESMMKTAVYIIAVYALILFAGNALAADLSVGSNVTITGPLDFNGKIYSTPSDFGGSGPPGIAATISVGNVATVPFGSPAIVTNAGTANAAILNFQIPAGPKGDSITGAVGPVGLTGEAGPRGASFVLHSTTLTNSPNYTGAWTVNKTTWTPLNVPYEINVTADNSYIRVTWTDNVGIYGPNWCNVGIFIDDNISVPPVCSGAWSGVSGTTIFNQQTLVCILPQLTPGFHTVGVYHRSQYCYYGYTAFDLDGGSRKLIIEALQ